MNPTTQVIAYLEAQQIPFSLKTHAPLMTIEEALPAWADLEGVFCKNLFFRNHKGNQHFLVVLLHHKILNVKELEKQLKQGRLSFASPERMQKHLGLAPGSVSPFGLLNDVEKHVIVFLDEDLKNADKVNFHPNENTATITIEYADFQKYLAERGNEVHYISIP